MFPTLSFAGTLDTQSGVLSSLLEAPGHVWLLAAGLVFQLFGSSHFKALE
jgi:hypothetical protein